MKSEIKERPILFSGEMVRAIFEGRKTMTRRIVKPQPLPEWTNNPDGKYLVWGGQNGWTTRDMPIKCPYGRPGDRLWVRETWAWWSDPDGVYDDGYWYRANQGDNLPSGFTKWCSPIFMPRAASRILLEITDVRVERVQDISEDDATAEGVEFKMSGITSAATGWRHYLSGFFNARHAKDSFNSLWRSIHGPESWAQNPWVWAITFKRIKP